MRNIKILDCTLRDGGYVNNWDFGESSIIKILATLTSSKVDYIEYGFLQSKPSSGDSTLFSTFSQAKSLLQFTQGVKPILMINYGEYELSDIPDAPQDGFGLRVAFKKHQLNNALSFCNALVKKGYDVFVNPMHTSTYEINEWKSLIQSVNEMVPKALTIVDTNGAMREYEVLSYYNILADSLDKKIVIGFHSHNNLQLSLCNSKCLIDACSDRELIIDATLMGMGRGAGNLATEVLAQYLNDNLGTMYDVNSILTLIEQEIVPIYKNYPWSYSFYYYLAAIYNCHPNYAKLIKENPRMTITLAKDIFSTMPVEKRTCFDKDFITSY